MPTSPLLDTVQPVPELARAHDQVAAYYRAAIREGRLEPGQPFPAVRDAARDWGVSVNTIRRAMSALKEEGLIDYSQGRQAVVLAQPGGSQT